MQIDWAFRTRDSGHPHLAPNTVELPRSLPGTGVVHFSGSTSFIPSMTPQPGGAHPVPTSTRASPGPHPTVPTSRHRCFRACGNLSVRAGRPPERMSPAISAVDTVASVGQVDGLDVQVRDGLKLSRGLPRTPWCRARTSPDARRRDVADTPAEELCRGMLSRLVRDGGHHAAQSTPRWPAPQPAPPRSPACPHQPKAG